MTKKIGPNVLDRLFNIAVPDKDVKKWLADRAERLAPIEVAWEHDERTARRRISANLTKWVEKNGLTGRGTKKLVDKVVAKVIRGHETRLWRRLQAKEREIEVDDAITLLQEAGLYGSKNSWREPEWKARHYAGRGKRLATKFQQKNR